MCRDSYATRGVRAFAPRGSHTKGRPTVKESMTMATKKAAKKAAAKTPAAKPVKASPKKKAAKKAAKKTTK